LRFKEKAHMLCSKDMLSYSDSIALFSYPSLSSTMDEARRLAASGFPKAAIVRADTQTSGRGRVPGRSWDDVPGCSLLMTIILPSSLEGIPALPLRAGLGVIRALENAIALSFPQIHAALIIHQPQVLLLKWPNDIIANYENGYGKLCGILCESSAGRSFIGIGLNLKRSALSTAQGFAEPHSLSATFSKFPPMSVEELCGALPSGFETLDNAARAVTRGVFDALIDPWWKEAYEARLWRRGERLRFLAGHPENPTPIEGVCEGVEEDGSLKMNIDGISRTFASGEISSAHSA
jgi:biotin-(acetyl-CoA carboxylase) ligase